MEVSADAVLERGRLGPGDMIAVDTVAGRLLRNEEIKAELAGRRPYAAWLERSIQHVGVKSTGGQVASGLGQVISYATLLRVLGPAQAAAAAGDAPVPAHVTAAVGARVRLKKAFGYSKEVRAQRGAAPQCTRSSHNIPPPCALHPALQDEELILKPMSEAGHEPIGSMGDDTPIAAFSAKPQVRDAPHAAAGDGDARGCTVIAGFRCLLYAHARDRLGTLPRSCCTATSSSALRR